MQREPIALSTQRSLRLRERLPAPVASHPRIALPRAFAQCRTALHCRRCQFWQQFPTVARYLAVRPVAVVHPLPQLAQTPPHPIAHHAHQLRHVAVGQLRTFGAGKLLGDTEGYQRPLTVRPRGKRSSGGVDTSDPPLPHLSVSECVRYTLTLDPDVALLGLSYPNEQHAAWAAARTFTPMDAAELAATRDAAARAIVGKGEAWWNPRGTVAPGT